MSNRRKFFGIISIITVFVLSFGYNSYSNSMATAEENKKAEASYQLEKSIRASKEAQFSQLVEKLKKE
jgi:hypothetical protein